MDLQATLKKIKLNENNISMALGVLILIVIGAIVVNYFRNQTPVASLPTGVTTEQAESIELPTKHTVATGETLWSIAEKYYKSGYNWVDIQKENNLTNASEITTGLVLNIPDVEAKTATVTDASPIAQATATPTATIAATATATPRVSSTPNATVIPVPTETPKGGVVVAPTAGSKIDGTNYTVVKGDSLWTVAVRAYGDGYKWTEIARANKLVQPGTIHPGNVLTLPR